MSLPIVSASPHNPDLPLNTHAWSQIKDKVANHSRSADSMTYKENRDKSSSSSSSLSSSSGQAQLADAEQQQKKAKRPADYKADERQSIFDGRRGVGKYMDFLSPGEVSFDTRTLHPRSLTGYSCSNL